MEVLICMAIGYVCFMIFRKVTSYNDPEWVKEAIVGRNDAQVAVIRYFGSEPNCLSKKLLSDEEYDEMVEFVLSNYNLKQKALDKIGLDEDELNELEPVHFEGYQFDKDSLSKEGEDGKWRSSKYQVSWLFFSINQVFLYQYTFNMDSDDKEESTKEYFYKDITSFSTSTDTIETSISTVDSNRFTIIVPGNEFYCSLEQSDYTENAINGMKSLLRDKKNNE